MSKNSKRNRQTGKVNFFKKQIMERGKEFIVRGVIYARVGGKSGRGSIVRIS